MRNVHKNIHRNTGRQLVVKNMSDAQFQKWFLESESNNLDQMAGEHRNSMRMYDEGDFTGADGSNDR